MDGFQSPSPCWGWGGVKGMEPPEALGFSHILGPLYFFSQFFLSFNHFFSAICNFISMSCALVDFEAPDESRGRTSQSVFKGLNYSAWTNSAFSQILSNLLEGSELNQSFVRLQLSPLPPPTLLHTFHKMLLVMNTMLSTL